MLKRYIYGAVAVAAIAAFLWYRTSLIEQGREQARAKVERAIEQQRAVAEENAAIYESQRAERQIEYRDRAHEVVKYVPTDNTACDWSDDARRVFQRSIDSANAAR
ncbi:MAG TPA: hypothetical protein VK991_12945 [Halomonas sp.]|nr:hypothetical protein [Halomonas sp.]